MIEFPALFLGSIIGGGLIASLYFIISRYNASAGAKERQGYYAKGDAKKNNFELIEEITDALEKQREAAAF